MKKSELRQIIREEISKELNEEMVSLSVDQKEVELLISSLEAFMKMDSRKAQAGGAEELMTKLISNAGRPEKELVPFHQKSFFAQQALNRR